MVRVAKGKGKKVAKSKGIGKIKPKGKNALKPNGGINKEGKCFHCVKPGHRKRNYPVYLEDVKKAKAVGASVSGGLLPLMTCSPFINLLEILNHLICNHVLELLLKLRIHGGKHKTSDINMSSMSFSNSSLSSIGVTSTWNKFFNDIFLPFQIENNSHVINTNFLNQLWLFF
ncbi:hypothetical protein V6N13_048431 [Hibiscus sabdariffa]